MDRTYVTPVALVTAAFVAAGGYVHAREWFQVYRDVPSDVPGAWVVRIGFPVQAVVSVALAAAVVMATLWWPRRLRPVVAAAAVLQVGSIAALVLSSEATLFGWSEAGYTDGARQTLAVESGALVCIGALVALDVVRRRSGSVRAGTVPVG